MTSVSLEAWKIEPSLSSSRRKLGGVGDVAVVRNRDLALVASRPRMAARCGSAVSPVVE